MGSCGHHYFEAGDMGKPSLQALRMLWPLSPAAADHKSDHQRHTQLPGKHVVPLGRLVDDLLNRQKRKLRALVNDNWPHTYERRSDRYASHAVLRSWHVEHTPRSILFLKPQ